jgi:CRISPR-associated protein Csx10
MKAVLYDLKLLTPVLVTERQGDQNSAVSSAYLHGSVLRGAIAGLYTKRYGAFDAETCQQARTLFLNDQTRFLNAYPLGGEDDTRALPAPVSLRYSKDEIKTLKRDEKPQTVFDLSQKPSASAERSMNESDYEKVVAPFVWLKYDAVQPQSQRQVNVHTQRDAVMGRATEEAGEVYRYEAIAAGSRFQAMILADDDVAPLLVDLLRGQTLWVGRARRAAYGKVQVVGEPRVEAWGDWRENPNPPTQGVKEWELLTITFTSPAILRDEWGQPTLNPQAALEAALSTTLTPLPQYSFVTNQSVDGFNRLWGLYLMQSHTIGAGSVFVYGLAAAITAETAQRLEAEGLGERRAEGFGRVAVNWHTQDEYTRKDEDSTPAIELPKTLSDQERKCAEQIAERILCTELEKSLRKKIIQTGELENAKDLTTNHQLSRLRRLIRELQLDVGSART